MTATQREISISILSVLYQNMGEYPAKLLHLIRVASLSQGEIMEVSRISVRLLHLCGDSIQPP